jgi:hypothetical protein
MTDFELHEINNIKTKHVHVHLHLMFVCKIGYIFDEKMSVIRIFRHKLRLSPNRPVSQRTV